MFYTNYDFLIIIGLILTFGAQIFVKYSFNKYAKVKNKKGVSGFQAATAILQKHHLNQIKIITAGGWLGDYYNPGAKTVALSPEDYKQASISAVAVAAHECGHVIQDHEGFSLLSLRNRLIPIVNFCSYLGYIAIMIGLFFDNYLFWLGILFELVILGFQILTLPIEFDASKKALNIIEKQNILDRQELSQAQKVLQAAAFTYVAGTATTLLQILRLVGNFSRRQD